ncbi:MAG: hypothetical protein IRZ02_01075 [Acidothermus sp.]|nr:hypothetical protein [Acidothermus sp.]MCL6538008.1 hypothetical protein [Acidothermus sp.]
MASWTNDGQLHVLMREYLDAASRLDEAREKGLPQAEIDRLSAEKQAAARAYEDALLQRGWQIPGLAIGPLARSTRW